MTGRAGRAKKTGSSLEGRRSSNEGADVVSEVLMKERIKTLEAEVYTLKARLEALRRAKNTTIVKGGVVKPGRNHTSDHSHGDVIEKCSCDATISELKRSHELEMNKLKEQLKAMDHQQDDVDDRLHQKIKELQQNNEQLHHDNEQLHHGKERLHHDNERLHHDNEQLHHDNERLHHDNEQLHHDNEQLHHDKDELQSQLDGVVVANAQLASCNSLLRNKCDQMLEQLSVKEAKWSHYEEQLQLQLRQQWGERYQEWITKAENKMKELQSINQMLQAMLKTKQEHVELQ